jgi:hypothetical protein
MPSVLPLEPMRWVLVRLDDNGNEHEMVRFLTRKNAEQSADRYTQKGHKQAYFVRAAK